MPSKIDVFDELTEIFRDVFVRDDLTLTSELSARDVEGWDSFKQIEIILATEQRFGIRLNTREIDGLRNVGDLARTVSAKLSA
jgi:acyl carrier protein